MGLAYIDEQELQVLREHKAAWEQLTKHIKAAISYGMTCRPEGIMRLMDNVQMEVSEEPERYIKVEHKPVGEVYSERLREDIRRMYVSVDRQMDWKVNKSCVLDLVERHTVPEENPVAPYNFDCSIS